MDGSLARAVDGIRELAHLPQLGRVFIALMADRRVPLWLKLAAGAGAVYVISPVDVIPDAITGIGLLDDVVVVFLILQTFVELAPRAVVLEHCERMGLDPQDVHINIADAISGIVGAIASFLEGRKEAEHELPERPAGAGYSSQQAPANGESVVAAPIQAAEPRYKRYSAFSTERQG